MPYQINLTKTAPCNLPQITLPPATQCIRTLEVYGCTPDLTQGEGGSCVQGAYTSVGCCCRWVVPDGVTTLHIELWGGGGGGGSGASSNCCGNMPGGGGGSFQRSRLTVAPGDVMTFCAGAGGCGGANCEGGTNSWCCCGQQGNCSFVMRNGNMCVDAWGGGYGPSVCYYGCGCMWNATCGNAYAVSGCSPCGANGNWGGCFNYTSGYNYGGGPTVSLTPGCGAEGYCQTTMAAGTTFGADVAWWQHNCYSCWHYLRNNTGCTNSAGIAGPGGDPGPAGTAYNTPGSTQYACANVDTQSCARWSRAPHGAFPGGGGPSGVTTTCCFRHSNGGVGGAGYIRVLY